MERREPADQEGGMTLVEVVITVAIISIAFVAILSALGVMISSGALHRQQTRSETAARNAAEFVKQPASYVACATPTSYNLSSVNLPSGYTATVISVQVIDNAAAGSPTYSSSTCPGSDPGVQRISIRVCPHGVADGSCTAGSDDAQSVQVIKRKSIA